MQILANRSSLPQNYNARQASFGFSGARKYMLAGIISLSGGSLVHDCSQIAARHTSVERLAGSVHNLEARYATRNKKAADVSEEFQQLEQAFQEGRIRLCEVPYRCEPCQTPYKCE